jgi:hypothetical protein
MKTAYFIGIEGKGNDVEQYIVVFYEDTKYIRNKVFDTIEEAEQSMNSWWERNYENCN